jgi:hypothetical protein
MAMGTAQTAAAQDATAAYWNPAALPWLCKFEVSLMYSAAMQYDRNHNYVAAALRADRIGTFGLSWINSGITGIGQYDGTGARTGDLDVSNNAFQLSYARPLGNGFGFGLSAKYLQEDLADNDGYGIDAGLMFKPYDELQFGLMARDIAAEHGEDQVPYEIRLGTGVRPWKSVLLTADLAKVEEEEATVHVGGAYDFDISDNVDFYIAAGMANLAETEQAQSALTAGFGFGFKNWAIQYAYVEEPQDFLKENHKISVNFFFKDCNPMKSSWAA